MNEPENRMTSNPLTSEQIESLFEQSMRERERLAQENLPKWYQNYSALS